MFHIGRMGQIAYEFRVEMSRALYESYLLVLASGECRTQYEAVERARKSQAPHYFTSEWHCARMLAKMFAGEPTGLRNVDKVRKFDRLFEEAKRYREEHEEWPGLVNVCRDLVRRPAPEYYICHNTAKQIILQERKRRREEVVKRWVR